MRNHTSSTQSLRAQSTVKVFELAPPATKTPLVKDPIPGLVDASMEKDLAEILPGMSPVLRWVSRIAPA